MVDEVSGRIVDEFVDGVLDEEAVGFLDEVVIGTVAEVLVGLVVGVVVEVIVEVDVRLVNVRVYVGESVVASEVRAELEVDCVGLGRLYIVEAIDGRVHVEVELYVGSGTKDGVVEVVGTEETESMELGTGATGVGTVYDDGSEVAELLELEVIE